MKNKFSKILAASLSGAMVVSLAAACGNGGKDEGKAVSYVGIDVNPSVSLVLDKNDKVLSVLADNEDAQVLLYGENLVGMSADEAAKKIAALSVELGYLNENNRGVNITVEGKADAEKLSSAVEGSFEAAAEGLDLRFTSEGTFSLNRELNAVKAEYSSDAAIQGLTLGKFKLIVEAQSVDGTLTFTAAADMDVSELLNLISQKAETIEPYATAAYTAAKNIAYRAYYNTKSAVLDSLWAAPYTKDALASLVPGYERKYDVNYGAVYGVYTNSARALNTALDVAEKAADIAEKTQVSDDTLNAIASAMGMSDTEKAAFIAEITKNGKTVAALDKYFDAYFKNLTADELAAAKQKMNEVMEKVQAEAEKIDAAIAEEYKAALDKFLTDSAAAISALIPEQIKETVGAYLDELNTLLSEIKSAAEGKEPKAAAYSALKVLETRAEKILGTMRTDLTEEDLKAVEEAIAKVDETLTAAEKKFTEALEKAEQEAKDYLASLKASRTQPAA